MYEDSVVSLVICVICVGCGDCVADSAVLATATRLFL